MIKTHSDDLDVAAAAGRAADEVQQVLASLPTAEAFDYGGHTLRLGEYGLCVSCSGPIAEAQQAAAALYEKAEATEDQTVKEHIDLAAQLFEREAEAAQVRAEFHNGHGSEKILNTLLGFIHNRSINDSYDHSHNQGG